MGKAKQKFNKKQAVRFTLVPGFDENGKPITHFRPVETKKSKVNPMQRQKIIMEISDETYDQIQINGRLVGQNEIPAFVLEQIKGRKDLVFNQKAMGQNQEDEQEGDLYQIADAKDYDDFEQFDQQQEKVWIEEGEVIDEEYDEEELGQDDQQWEEADEDMMQEQVIDGEEQDESNKKPFKLDQQEFPVLSKVNIQGKQYELTQAQIKLLDVLIPENYQNYQIKGLHFQKYDQHGLPFSQKTKYQEFLATGTQGIVDRFDYVPQNPTPIFDTDLKPSQIKGDLKQVEDALNFDGEQGVYEELEDDFFAKLIKSQIQTNQKQNKNKKSKSKKTLQKPIKSQPRQITKAKWPKELEAMASKKQENIFSKYNELDQDVLEEEITDQMLDKALDDFEQNLEPKQGVKLGKHQIKLPDQEQMEERDSTHNISMNYSELQKCPQFIGRDGEMDWRCLTRKEKKQYMKTKIIRSFYDEIRERQIEEKLKGKKNITSEQLHLKSLVQHLSFEEDHVMRRALEQHAKEEVDMDEEQSYSSESEEQDIIEYRQRTSVISSNLNEITEPYKRKQKKKAQDEEQRLKQLDQLSQTLSKLKTAGQKRDRNETKEQRKARKEKQKQLKKQKKQVKKQFAEKFSEERRRHMNMTKPSDPLHKVSFVKII